MLRYLILPVVLQALLIIHVFKNGKDRYWIYLLLFIPGAGGIAYFFVEVLPDLLSSKTARKAKTKLFSNRDFKELQKIASYSPTVENKRKLASAYCERNEYAPAIPLLEECLSGVFSDDLHMRLLLVEALYNEKQIDKLETNLDVLTQNQEHAHKSEVIYWQAQLADCKHDNQHALQLFKKASENAVDLKYQYFYLEYLAAHQGHSAVISEGAEILHHINHFPKHSIRFNRQWISMIKKRISQSKSMVQREVSMR